MYRADLADEPGAELAEHSVRLQQLAPEQLRGVGVIAGVLVVVLKRDRALDLVGGGPDRHIEAELRNAAAVSA